MVLSHHIAGEKSLWWHCCCFPIYSCFHWLIYRILKEPLLKALHVTHAKILNQLLNNRLPLYCSNRQGIPISENIAELKGISEQLFEDLEEGNLFTLNFNMIDQMFWFVEDFCFWGLLDASSSEHFNYTIKRFLERHPQGKLLLCRELSRQGMPLSKTKPGEIEKF